MKDPRHPPGSAFEKSSDHDEYRRQQLIAALTPGQRHAYEQLCEKHEIAQNHLHERQERSASDRIAERMRHHLLQHKEPHLRPNVHEHQLGSRQELVHAAMDFLNGKETHATLKYGHFLKEAHKRAKDDVVREHGQQRQKLYEGQQRERADFLEQAQRDRSAEKTQKDFEKAARDRLWARAFNRAARKEADLDNPHDHDRPR